jgi:hypothetical protein
MKNLEKDAERINVEDLGRVPNLPHRSWVRGCKLELVDAQAYATDFQGGKVLYVLVVVTFPDGVAITDRLFLSTLVRAINAPGIYDYAKGTANKLVRSFVNWSDALKALVDKTMVVSEVRVHTLHTPMGEARTTNIYDLDIVK